MTTYEPPKPNGEAGFGAALGRFFVGVKEVMGRVAEAFATAAERLAETTRDADRIAQRYHWCVSTSWPLTFVVEIAEMGSMNATQGTVDRAILGFYRSNDWHELEELVQSIAGRSSMSPSRRRRIRDVVKVVRAGEHFDFNAANFVLPTLFAQLEGILRDFASQDLGLKDDARKLLSVRAMLEPLHACANAVEKPGLDLIVRRLWKSTKGREPASGERNTRHFHLYGHAHAPVRKTDILRLVLMIDLVTALIDRYRNATAEDPDITVQLRNSYAELLSWHATRSYAGLTLDTSSADATYDPSAIRVQ